MPPDELKQTRIVYHLPLVELANLSGLSQKELAQFEQGKLDFSEEQLDKLKDGLAKAIGGFSMNQSAPLL